MKISKIVAGLVAAGALSLPAFAQAQVFDYVLDSASPVINAGFGSAVPCAAYTTDPRKYKTVVVTVSTAGTYTFTDAGPSDAAAAIYSTFDPASPLSGCLASVDGLLDVNLAPGAYTLLLSQWGNGGTDFSINVTGPAPLTSGAPAPVPTLSEWAMILLGAVLAGGAALQLHRRRAAV